MSVLNLFSRVCELVSPERPRENRPTSRVTWVGDAYQVRLDTGEEADVQVAIGVSDGRMVSARTREDLLRGDFLKSTRTGRTPVERLWYYRERPEGDTWYHVLEHGTVDTETGAVESTSVICPWVAGDFLCEPSEV